MQSELFSIQSEQGVLEVFHPFFKRCRGGFQKNEGEQLRESFFVFVFLNCIYLFIYIHTKCTCGDLPLPALLVCAEIKLRGRLIRFRPPTPPPSLSFNDCLRLTQLGR